MDDVLLTGGGIIPEDDMEKLNEMGVGKLFAPGATTSEIADYIRVANPAVAELVRASILDSLQIIAGFPGIGRVQSTEGVRKLVTRRYKYLVYYTTDESADEVVTLSIRHGAREGLFDND